MSTTRSRRSYTTIRGSIPSKKSTRRMVHYHGLLQRAYIYLLEYDPLVLHYEEQPFSISYHAGKQIARYAPEFRVIWKHQRPRLVACHPRITGFDLAAFTAAQLWGQQHNHDVALITEETLSCHRVLLSNLEMLAVHSFAPIPPPIYDYLLTILLSIGGPFSPLDLVQRASLLRPFQTKSFLWNLVYHGEVLTDLTQPLAFSSTSLLWKGHHSDASPTHLVCEDEGFIISPPASSPSSMIDGICSPSRAPFSGGEQGRGSVHLSKA